MSTLGLETKLDGLEQYSRRANLRFQGLKETAGGEDAEGMIIDIINDMSVTPPLQSTEIVRCHRVGRTPAEPGRPQAVLVKSKSERRRDAILRQRGNLKTATRANRVFINEDLTAICAQLAYQAGMLRKEGKLGR